MKPFMPYMGGKRKMLRHLRLNFPSAFRDYYEPFLGGGAVALDFMEQAWVTRDTSHTFHLSDYSEDVVAAWIAVKDHPEELERLLRSMMDFYSRDTFTNIRNWDRDGLLPYKSVAERGARFIFLNHTAFGGSVAQTSKGWLNASYAYKGGRAVGGVTQYDYAHMRTVSAMLNALDVTITRASYETALNSVGYRDFVYLDPPYDEMTDSGRRLTSNYLKDGIDQSEVKDAVLSATAAGSYVLLSNADTPLTRSLYEGWACSRPSHYWAVGGGARAASELLVANWRLADHLHRNLAVAA